MINRFKPILIILALWSPFASINVKSGNTFYSETSIFAQNQDVFIHVVERGQTVYSISKTYNVPIDLIYKFNPGSDSILSVGQELKIPQISGSYIFHTILPKETLYSLARKYYMTGEDIIEANPGLSIQTFSIGKTIRIPVNQVTHPIEGDDETKQMEQTNALLKTIPSIEKVDIINVALLLPFAKDEKDKGQQRRFIEYYEGFLMAIDSLKRTGISTHLQIYDIGYNEAALKQILVKPDLKQANLIIGGYTEEQIKALSDFTEKLQIPYVIPFTSKSDEPLSSPNTYQINTPYSFLYARAANAFCDKYKDGNIIFIVDDSTDKSEFTQALEAELKRRNMAAQILTYNTKLALSLGSLLRDNVENVIVPTSGTKEMLIKIVAPLLVLKQNKSTKQMTIFGHPEWQRYGAEYMNSFFTLNTTIYSIFYVDQNSLEVKTFYNQFRKWYSSNILDSYPKYSMLGFDTGMFFISGLNQFGAALNANINKVQFQGIQTDFRFKRVSNWGGFINTNLYFITFNPDYTIEKRIVAN